MSYEPTNWKSGDTVTSAKLNKMEQGIAGGANILIVEANSSTIEGERIITLDKTWQEISDADIFFIVTDEGDRKKIDFAFEIGIDQGDYYVRTVTGNYEAQAADDYPVASGGR